MEVRFAMGNLLGLRGNVRGVELCHLVFQRVRDLGEVDVGCRGSLLDAAPRLRKMTFPLGVYFSWGPFYDLHEMDYDDVNRYFG